MSWRAANEGLREGEGGTTLPQQRRPLTHTQAEVIERVLVDDIQLRPQGHCKFHHGAQMAATSIGILVNGSTHHDGQRNKSDS